jgi:predicted O-linked N-acetylglucosamine transferase (SPINDLY family)
MIPSRIARALLARLGGGPSAEPPQQVADRLIAEGNRAEQAGDLREACLKYRAAAEAAPAYARAHLNLGIGLEAIGDGDAALRSYEAALACAPEDAYALYNLGALMHRRGATEQAESLLARALESKPDFTEAQIVLADVRESRGDLAGAAASLEAACRGRPQHAGAAYNHALVLQKLGRTADAESALRRALALEPRNIEAALRLGNLLLDQGRASDAESCYRSALEIEPARPDVLNGLGTALASRHELQQAAAAYRRALAARPDFPDALCNLGNVLHLQGRTGDALACYEKALALDPAMAEAHYNAANVLKEHGRLEESLRSYRQALSLRPEYAEARWAFAMAQIPVVYDDETDISRCRAAFLRELDELGRWFTPERSERGHVAVGAQQPFYLAYQEENNQAVLGRYGMLCARLMRQWLDDQRLPAPKRAASDREIRIGIVSQHFHDHSVWNAIVRGWLQRLDPERFRIHAFYVGTRDDAETALARSRAGRFDSGPRSLRQWVESILSSEVDVLIYPEIGMDTTTLKLASLRLAPVQAASWGHPQTSGLPTIDYFLSAQAFEPDGAQSHYTERLLSLPGVGCYYEPSGVVPAHELPTSVTGGDEPLLVCAGAPFKYLPSHDALLIEIARRLGKCRFLFFEHPAPGLSARLKQRLQSAFSRSGMALDRYAVFLPWQSAPAFYGLLSRADAYLDTIGFSGFNTAMQALECGLPIVAWEGKFMRGRLASGALGSIGLDDLIADSAESYIALAVRLCRDAGYRADVRDRIARHRAKAWRDESVIRAMEECLQNLVRQARRPPP